MYGLWRGLERLQAPRGAQRVARVAVNPHELARTLQELIAAIDRRLPRVEQAGEAAIARDATVLREKAVRRLKELTDQNTASRAGPTNS